jgi:hypothetical protein
MRTAHLAALVTALVIASIAGALAVDLAPVVEQLLFSPDARPLHLSRLSEARAPPFVS